MPFTLVGWTESQDTGGTLTDVAFLADQHVSYEGDKLHCPSLNQLLGLTALGTTITQARLISPSLKTPCYIDIAPLHVASEPVSPAHILDIFESPIPLIESENVGAQVAEGASGAEYEHVLAWLGNGPVTKAVMPYRTVRATGSTTLSAYAWTPVTITLAQDLAPGNYNILGLKAISTGAIAARFVIPNYQWRPGVLACDTIGDIDVQRFRFGNAGIMGVFNVPQLPQIEMLSVSGDTSETFYVDLAGPV
jgi:hypothetical protein